MDLKPYLEQTFPRRFTEPFTESRIRLPAESVVSSGPAAENESCNS